MKAIEFIKNKSTSFDSQMRRNTYNEGVVESLCIEFAKIHVVAALKAAANNAEMNSGEFTDDYEIDKQSILNAYPLTNIK